MFHLLQYHLQNSSLNQMLSELLGMVFIVSLGLYWYGTWTFAILKKIGIPGPTPRAFVGNFADIQKAGGLHLFLLQCLEKYGTVFTTCYGRRVAVIIAEPEIIKQVMVKEFQNFRNRIPFDKLVYPISLNVATLRDEDWKRIRNTLAPAFSAAKLKVFVDLIETAVNTLQDKLMQVADTGTSVDIKEWFAQMTLEVILSAAFGVESDVQNNQNSKVLKKTKAIFHRPAAVVHFISSLPFGNFVLNLIGSIDGRYTFFIDTALGIIRFRQEQAKEGIVGRKDLIQLLLTAHQESGPEGKASKLTNDEIVAQCVIFLMAGQETSSSALTFTTYLLALNPDVQENLRSEIELTLKSNPEVTMYNLVNRMEYLECVVNESLRLYPPGYVVNRECEKACTINGFEIPAGIEVQFPIYALHHDPKAWPDAEKFDPERFRAANKGNFHPFQFLPFGSGPRNCIAMRFALLEIKLTLVKLLMKFRFVRSPETQVPLQVFPGLALTARDGVHVRVESIYT